MKLISELIFLVSICCISASITYAQTQDNIEFNTAMIENTFIVTNDKTLGTGFILTRPDKQNPDHSYYVLVTANHVLAAMEKEAVIVLRRKLPDNTFEIFPLRFSIRNDKGDPLWKTADSDIAVMYVTIPAEFQPSVRLPVSLLASDETMKKYEIHPGDELLALGYPYRQSSPVLYPILRSGRIASYPLLPTKNIKTFYLDFEVYTGNSGGPVYLSQNPRAYDNALKVGQVNLILGLVSKQLKEPITEMPIKIAVIIPAQFIIDAINHLPDKPTN